ncbi:MULTISPECIES: hypothetical protein [Candidatus Nitrosocaldus]|jgi:hypothetical protein|uniref:Uncharacterized protein n=1 Tax=Candidatus Nitrosocaldus cavascurensis TaxID=2058097 RepID=A0A2K5ARN2_9ARCH|nr:MULTISPECIES: hypothetical protein [Candidatus Nitrosocaldus]SPC34306.1 conserved protein of unknown function [Candidatus Nitrosocaldus cavascurensis]
MNVAYDNDNSVNISNKRRDERITDDREKYDRYDGLKVYVTGVDASDVTSRLNGYFTLDGAKIRFQGIAFGRIGGHNIHVKISKRAEAMLKRMGYDPEHVLVAVQMKMIEGDITIEEREMKE